MSENKQIHFDVSQKTLGRPEKIGKQVWAFVFLVRHLWVFTD